MSGGKGDCYQAAGNLICDFKVLRKHEDAVLVHAAICPVYGPLKGVTHGHAWVEVPDKYAGVAHDYSNGRQIEMAADAYRRLAGVLGEQRYTITEAARMMCDTRHYGPWDEALQEAAHA
jgi:hypothetical protein